MKFDKTGVGHDIAKEFTNHWWDQAFKKASNGIHIEKLTEDGEIEVKSRDKTKSKMKAKSEKKEEKKSLYKAFVKSATLENGKLVKEKDDASSSSSSEMNTSSTVETHIQALDYDELFKSIGVTAHKGARHGVSMQAKLKRVQQKDEEYLRLQKKKKKKKTKSDNIK